MNWQIKQLKLLPTNLYTAIMTPSTRDNNPAQICAEVTQEEWARWESLEAVKDETGTWAMRGKPILTRKYLMSLAGWFHDKIHRDITTIVNQIEKMWTVPGIHMAVKRIVHSCPTCWKLSDAKPKQEVGGLITISTLPIPQTAN